MTPSENRQFVEALARGLAILETLSRAHRPLSNGALARETGLPPSTVSRLTHTLSVLGYVRLMQSSRCYELTAKNLTLGYPVLAGLSLIQRAQPLLKEISEQTGETAALAIRDGLHITFVDVNQGRNMVAVRLAMGGRLPIAGSAAGVALVAALPEKEQRSVGNRIRSHISKRGGDVKAFDRYLAEAQHSGVSVVRNAWRVGIGGVAIAVESNGEFAALVIPVATGSVTEAAMRGPLADTLRAAAQRLSGAEG